MYSKYHWISNTTGELQANIWGVIKTTISDLFRYHVLNTWKYNKGGF